MKTKRKLTPTQRLRKIQRILACVWDEMPCQGPLASITAEMCDEDIQRIYALAKAPKRK